MAAIRQLAVSVPSTTNLRPLDSRRDLYQVADLIELCFADTLDPDGHSYLHQMRTAAHNPVYQQWSNLAERVPFSYGGYVWEEDDRVVGNLTMIPCHAQNQHYYLVANVAVHPQFRRRQIARHLTQAAIDQARRQGANAVWLHVRDDNPAAINLYLSLGFIEKARRTTWQSSTLAEATFPMGSVRNPPPVTVPQLQVGGRRPQDWLLQQEWMNRIYPAEIVWHLSLRQQFLRPGFWMDLYRFFADLHIVQWSARYANRLAGVLTWQASSSYSDYLWLAAPPESENLAAYALLSQARRSLDPQRPLALDYPAESAVDSLRAAGFYPHQTLIWMRIGF